MILYSLYVKFTLYAVNQKCMRSRAAIFVYIICLHSVCGHSRGGFKMLTSSVELFP